MKKIITLLFCSAILTSAFAKKNDHDRKDDKNYSVYQNNNYRVAERDRMIQKISNQYDFKIQQVNNDRRMNRRQKKIAIRNLQAEKTQQINRVNSEYNSSTGYNRSYNKNYNNRSDRGYHDRDDR